MKLLLHAEAASGAFRTQCLDLEYVGSVWVELSDLNGAFLQNQDRVGGHIPLTIVILKHLVVNSALFTSDRRQRSTKRCSYFSAVHELVAVIDVDWRSARQRPGQRQTGGAAIIQMDERHLGGI